MTIYLRLAAFAVLASCASPALAQTPSSAPPEPLPLGVASPHQAPQTTYYYPSTPYYSPTTVYYPGAPLYTYSTGSVEYVYARGYWWDANATWTTPAAKWTPWTGWTYPAAQWNPQIGWVYPLSYPMPGRLFLGGN